MYQKVQGLLELRKSIAAYYTHKYGTEYTADDVLIGPGSKELMYILQKVYQADLYLPQASWVSYAPQAELLGRKVFWLKGKQENGFRFSIDEFMKITKDIPQVPKLVILNYPCNPTGVTYNTEQLKELAQCFRARKTLVLADEIYSELYFEEGSQDTLSKYYPEGTIISSGISKWAGAGGWRLGFLLFPPELRPILKAMLTVCSETYSAVSAPVQYASILAYDESPEIKQYIKNQISILKPLGNLVHKKLTDAGVVMPKPQGGFYLFPDFSHIPEVKKKFKDVNEACQSMLENSGVAVLPGDSFGMDPSILATRLAYVDFDGGKALEAVERGEKVDMEFFKKYCPNVLEGADAIVSWIEKMRKENA
jgi:aspartate aminotransferase